MSNTNFNIEELKNLPPLPEVEQDPNQVQLTPQEIEEQESYLFYAKLHSTELKHVNPLANFNIVFRAMNSNKSENKSVNNGNTIYSQVQTINKPIITPDIAMTINLPQDSKKMEPIAKLTANSINSTQPQQSSQSRIQSQSSQTSQTSQTSQQPQSSQQFKTQTVQPSQNNIVSQRQIESDIDLSRLNEGRKTAKNRYYDLLELKAIAKRLGLNSSGNKSDLVFLIKAQLK